MIEKFFSYLESKGYRPQDEIYQIIIDLSKLDCIYLRPNNSIIIKSTKRLILEDYFNNKKIFNFPNFQYVRICVLKGLKEPPRCPVCGKIVSIMGKANREGKNSGTQFNKTCGDPNCTNEWVKMQSREKYGTDYPQQSEKVKEKAKKSNIEKYGVSCTLLTKEVQEKTKQTNLKKYGAEHASSSSIIKERVKETNIKNGFWTEENIKNRRILNESRSQGISIYSTQENFEKILKEKGYVETENVFQLLEVLFNNKWISINKNNKFILNTSSKVNNSLELINYFLKSNNIDPEIDSWNCLSLIFEQSLKQRPHCPYCGNVCKDQEVSFSGTCGSQECINKLIKDSTFKNFGTDNPNTLPEIKEKIKRTTLERHGVDNAMKSEVFKRKSRETNLERYGVEYATQNLEIKEKIKETNIKRYGGPSPLCSEEIKEKSKTTVIEKYGVENISQLDSIKAKKEATFMEHYGYKCNFQAPEIKEQIKQTNLEKYGYEYVFQNPYVQREMRKKYWYKDICFDSSWKLAFYIYHEDNNIPIEREPVVISFEIDGKEKHYYPDFRVNDQLIEIKGDMLIDENNNIKPYPKKVEDLKEKGQFKEIDELFKFCEAKTKAIKENNIKVIKNEEIKPYLKYIKDSYGKDYLKQFKVKK